MASGAGSPAVNLTALPIFGWNACGFLSRHCEIAFCLSFSRSKLLKQLTQLQPLQNSPFAKQSQYNFKHCDLVQLHGFLFGVSLLLVLLVEPTLLLVVEGLGKLSVSREDDNGPNEACLFLLFEALTDKEPLNVSPPVDPTTPKLVLPSAILKWSNFGM